MKRESSSHNNSDFKKALNSFSINSFWTPDISLLYKKLLKHKVKIDNIYITQGITECMSHNFSTLTKDDGNNYTPLIQCMMFC